MPVWGDVNGSVLLGLHEKVRGVFELHIKMFAYGDSSLLRSPELDASG